MPGGYLHGWDPDAEGWVRVNCNADGELLIDPLAIFEDAPSDGEMAKAPTSNWAYDHENDAVIHHARYTDVESRAAIDNILSDGGSLLRDLFCNFRIIRDISQFSVSVSPEDTYYTLIKSQINTGVIRMVAYLRGGGYVNTWIDLMHEGSYKRVIHTGTFQATLDDYLEEAPSNGVVDKAPTSNWAYDHENDAAIHDIKYTDLEAQQAVNLDGDVYHTIPGTSFMGKRPNVSDLVHHIDGACELWSVDNDIFCPVILPHGATVTAVKVDGNAGASSQTWTFNRVAQSNQGVTTMATAGVQTEDTSISVATIDNENYCYAINILGLDTNDKIFYVRIKYIL
ncbi:hypothetical protein LCGC14_2946340 [marine sediment metagenome]|uniref:Uncharacterized protein n=1 Tax=marine sediment metagenome TaxID=412755 RepID=A0A0F8Y3M3_9ZZZZ